MTTLSPFALSIINLADARIAQLEAKLVEASEFIELCQIGNAEDQAEHEFELAQVRKELAEAAYKAELYERMWTIEVKAQQKRKKTAAKAAKAALTVAA